MEDHLTAAHSAHEICARELMQIMLYDNGAVNRNEPETEKRYPAKHVAPITAACEKFFTAHPEFITNEHFENIAAGEEEENQELYGIYPEYEELSNALNNYFEEM